MKASQKSSQRGRSCDGTITGRPSWARLIPLPLVSVAPSFRGNQKEPPSSCSPHVRAARPHGPAPVPRLPPPQDRQPPQGGPPRPEALLRAGLGGVPRPDGAGRPRRQDEGP